MKSDAVRIAEIQAHERELQELLRNPVIELLLGFIVIGYINKGNQSFGEWMTGLDVMKTIEDFGLVSIIGLQQLGPQGIQAVAGFTGAGLTALGKTIPLLAAGA